MKVYLSFIFLLFVGFGLVAQTFHSKYNVIKTGNLFGDAKINMSNYDIDTIEIHNNNKLSVFVGTAEIFSNNEYGYLKFTIRKSSVENFVQNGTTMTCFIDYKNQTIYDFDTKSYFHYTEPVLDSFFANESNSIVYVEDSLSRISFIKDQDNVEIEFSKDIPHEIRGVVLTNDNKWGTKYVKSDNQLFELLNFSKEHFDFEKELIKAKQICNVRGETREMIIL